MEKTERAGQSFKHQLWDLDEESHIEGETEFEAAVAECCDARNRYCNRSCFSAHQRVFGSSLRLPGSLLSDDPIDGQLLTADPCTNFRRANEMRTAAQRALFKQNSARAVQAAGLARHRSQPREKHQCFRHDHGVAVSPTRTSFWISMRGCLLKCSSEQVRKATDAEWLGGSTSVVQTKFCTCVASRRVRTSQISTERRHQCGRHERNNKLTGRQGWTGPGVVVAVSPTRTSFWISMRGCLLKFSSEQVRKATDAEWLGAKFSKTLATELLKSRQRSGRYVDVETEGQPTEEPPADTRPDSGSCRSSAKHTRADS